MPVDFLRRLAGQRRSSSANRQLGYWLAFVAGAINAGGFLAIGRYTSHMTGILSAMADSVVTGDQAVVMTGLGSVVAFIAGSAYSAILINWGIHHRTHSKYAYPLLWEAALLLVFGLMGGTLETAEASLFVPMTVMLLCFIMGLQNAIITKISHAEIRTTHMTGIVTDIGIELGKVVYINSQKESAHYKPVRANFARLKVLGTLLMSFCGGGAVGALCFKYMGYSATIPLAVLLVFLAIVPLVDDARSRIRTVLRHRHAGPPPEKDGPG
ncbi:Predicted membrane protein [Magnetospirillum sp. LM-5]|uniref:YoaK family protein n=1 Tax=Magnetospirillum sp. LM-5 TaxID=2681466 RepID=UPI001381DFAA|nr:YoaK family protein [Magnetospirillum sp. LM-5]CAA7622045.1 Predicted membrane protein [Magnetospirillum sp. LM-5]